jgi:sugar diacid utilization regulator
VDRSIDSPSLDELLSSLPLAQLSAFLLRAESPRPHEVKKLRVAASENQVGVVVLHPSTDLRALANSINRNILPGQLDIAHLRVRGAHTLQEAADTLARLIGDSVTVETPQDDLLVFSALQQKVDRIREETILYKRGNPQVREWMDEEGYTDLLFRSNEPVAIPPNEALSFPGRRALRVARDGEMLGVIWLADVSRPLTRAESSILREGAVVIAGILLRERSVVQRDAELRAEFVNDVIRGTLANPENIRAVARSMGWNINRLQQAVVVEVDGTASRPARSLHPLRERLTELIRLEALTIDPEALIGARSEGAIVLFDPGQSDAAPRKTAGLEWGQRVIERIAEQRLGITVTIGVGRDFATVDELAESYRQASTAASVARVQLGGNRVCHFDELGIHRVLHVLQHYDVEVPESLKALVEHDKRHKSDYVRTLQVYLETMGKASNAAKILHLHRNSLDYRIRRIEQIVGSSLGDRDTRLSLEIGIRLLNLADGSTEQRSRLLA